MTMKHPKRWSLIAGIAAVAGFLAWADTGSAVAACGSSAGAFAQAIDSQTASGCAAVTFWHDAGIAALIIGLLAMAAITWASFRRQQDTNR
jgi:hypothetical protein